MFVFLADEKNRIDMPNRRDGKSGSLARGFFVWNSEVGSTSIGAAFFLFDYVCCNRIVWGAEEFKEFRMNHTAGAPARWIENIMPVLHEYSESKTAGVTQAIAAAQTKKIDDVDEFLKKRFSRKMTENIKAAHLSDENRPIETLWDATTAITAYARGVSYQNERIVLEREAGKVLDLAA
jgi:hypothetical protein